MQHAGRVSLSLERLENATESENRNGVTASRRRTAMSRVAVLLLRFFIVPVSTTCVNAVGFNNV